MEHHYDNDHPVYAITWHKEEKLPGLTWLEG
jgi:hypothetical protein